MTTVGARWIIAEARRIHRPVQDLKGRDGVYCQRCARGADAWPCIIEQLAAELERRLDDERDR